MLHFTDKETILESLRNFAKITQHLRLQSLIYLILLLSSQEKEARPLKTQADCEPRGSGGGHWCQPFGAAAVGSLVSKPTQHAKESSGSFEELR